MEILLIKDLLGVEIQLENVALKDLEVLLVEGPGGPRGSTGPRGVQGVKGLRVVAIIQCPLGV